MSLLFRTGIFLLAVMHLSIVAAAQDNWRTFQLSAGSKIRATNLFGKIEAISSSSASEVRIAAQSKEAVSQTEVAIENTNGELVIAVSPSDASKRIDIRIEMPPKMRLQFETDEGEVFISGEIVSASVRTITGTIAADVPTDDIKYEFHWNTSRPRVLSDVELERIREKSGGKFEIKGRFRDKNQEADKSSLDGEEVAIESDAKGKSESDDEKEPSKKKEKRLPAFISLKFVTERGIVLINIPPSEVTGDLRERPLTDAAKAIVRSGDLFLTEAIRRAAPKYYGEYTRSLGPVRFEPTLRSKIPDKIESVQGSNIATVFVHDASNRAISDLAASDFEIFESNSPREILSVDRTNEPFNLVLLLDISGSVENYSSFIRKAARTFINTVDQRDKISITTFNDDVKVLSGFSGNRKALSESLDTFDTGGPTAYYDALAFSIADLLRPMKGGRTAVVILTDGDDNRSFLPFESMLASIQESGALIYPLYVPTALIAASETSARPDSPIDELRQRYLQGELTSKANDEGKRLAAVSGGVYYPIARLSQIQAAYDDIVNQLRTAYSVKFVAGDKTLGGSDRQRVRIRIKRDGAFATIRSIRSTK